MANGKKTKKPSSSYSRKNTGTNKKKPSTALIKAVKNIVLNKIAEPKHAVFRNTAWFLTSRGYTGDMSVVALSPKDYVIAQGVGQSDRIGNSIKTKKAILSIAAYPLGYSQSNLLPTPLECVIYFGRLKETIAQPIVADYTQFYQLGNTSTFPTNQLIDILQSPNRDYFTVSKIIRFKLGYSEYYGTGNNTLNQMYTNNDFPYNWVKKIDITNLLAKTYKFNDTDNTPNNSATYMWCQVVPATGIVMATTTLAAIAHYNIDYMYTDV